MERLINTSGGKIAYGGHVNFEKKHVQPTIILEPKLDSELMTTEIFGPICPIFPFETISDAIKFINRYDKPLAVYYFGDPLGASSR